MAGVPLVPYREARSEFVARWDAIRVIALTHATQTNEARRCAVFLPELAKIRGPIALLEVGASAGLCLYPDKYAYRFITERGVDELAPTCGSSVVLETELRGRSAPTHLPEIVWRAGIDLNPRPARRPVVDPQSSLAAPSGTVHDGAVSEEPEKKPSSSHGTTILVGSLLVLSQVLTITSRLLNGESFLSPWVITSAALAVIGGIFAGIALTRTKRSR